MLSYVIRRLLYNVPVYLGILLIVMVALRVNNPVSVYLSKNADQEEIDQFRKMAGLDDSYPAQYWDYLKGFSLDKDSWKNPGLKVSEMLRGAVWPTVAITLPALLLTSVLSIVIGLVAAFNRGRGIDRALVITAVIGMSVSFLVYIVLGQYFGAFKLNESLGSDYIRTARAKGLTERRIMFTHMLKNAMVSIVTRIMITLPFLVTGSILLEMYFNIPGMGKVLISAINAKDFPVIQGFTAVFAVIFILSNILTDVLYGVVDPRVRLS